MDFSEMALGVVCMLVAAGGGVGSGIVLEKKSLHKRLKHLIADGEIRIAGRDGKSMSGDSVIALLSGK